MEVDVQFGRYDVVRPDLAGWRRERLLDPGDRRPIEVAPDWICEVLSPSTAVRDRSVKRQLYAEHRVAHYWIVDVDTPILDAFQLVAQRWMLSDACGESANARIAPFTDIELPVGRVFLPRTAADQG